jgi:hypothetical protein
MYLFRCYLNPRYLAEQPTFKFYMKQYAFYIYRKMPRPYNSCVVCVCKVYITPKIEPFWSGPKSVIHPQNHNILDIIR